MPLSTHCELGGVVGRGVMNWRGALFTVVALVLIFVSLFYSGAFMHGDPIE